MIVTMRNPLLHRLAGDEALAARARTGDDVAFAALMRRMQPRLTAYCAAILGNAQDADDAVQNTFIKALAGLRRDEAVDAVRPWLFRIAHNEAVSLMRRRRPAGELVATVPDHAHGPAEAVAVREEVRAVLQAIGELPDRSRDALLLREVAGMRHAEVAAVLGTSPGNARQAVFEARMALQDDRAGRDATCQSIREEISVRERRRSSRAVRGHLRACTSCQAWSEAQTQRRRVLGMAPGAGVPIAGGLWSWLAGLFGGGATSGGATVKVVASVAAVAAAAPVGVGTLERELQRRDSSNSVAEAPVHTSTAKAPAPGAATTISPAPSPSPAGASAATTPTSPASVKAPAETQERIAATPPDDGSRELEVGGDLKPKQRTTTRRRTAGAAPVAAPVQDAPHAVTPPRAAGYSRGQRRVRQILGGDDEDQRRTQAPEEDASPEHEGPQEVPEEVATTQEQPPPAEPEPEPEPTPTTTTTGPAPAPEPEPGVTTPAG